MSFTVICLADADISLCRIRKPHRKGSTLLSTSTWSGVSNGRSYLGHRQGTTHLHSAETLQSATMCALRCCFLSTLQYDSKKLTSHAAVQGISKTGPAGGPKTRQKREAQRRESDAQRRRLRLQQPPNIAPRPMQEILGAQSQQQQSWPGLQPQPKSQPADIHSAPVRLLLPSSPSLLQRADSIPSI